MAARNSHFQGQWVYMKDTKHSLRQTLRKQRKAVTPEQRSQASLALLTQAKKLKLFTPHQHIACYMAHDGEIDPTLLLKYAWELGKSCYLPIIPKHSNSMHFIKVQPEQVLLNNHFGILEPVFDVNQEIEPQELDLVIAPLVAFDKHGHRLGRGKGYYDQSFSFLTKSKISKPVMMGVAYQFQCVDELPSVGHDVPMHRVLTEEQYYDFMFG